MSTTSHIDRMTSLVLYDGKCPLCLRSVAILKKLDWLGALIYQDARSSQELPGVGATLARSKLLEEMHVLSPDRQSFRAGFKAFRWIARRIPLFWPLLPLMYLPGAPRLGQRVYLWVARNRFKLVPCRGAEGQCSIPLRGK